MAFNLQAVLQLNGNQFVNALRNIARQTQQTNQQTQLFTDSQGRLRDSLGRFASATGGVSRTMGTLGRAITSPIRAIGSLTGSLNGLISVYAAVAGAKKAFEETIGESAKYEQSSVIIKAMLNDEKLGQDYMKLVDKFAVDSPIMDSQAMLANSKSFLTQSKDMKQLEKMWSLAERMAAIDPMQGVEGSVFALRELFSGDAISMIRRFEMPREVMNDIKKLDLEGQLEALDKYFSNIGMTQKLIDEMGGTTLGVWAQIKEATNVILRDMGMPALNVVKDFLNEIKTGMASVSDVMKNRNFFTPEEFKKNLDRAMAVERFKETGGKILESVMTGFISAAKGIGGWIDQIRNNPEFQSQTTLFGQVKFIIEDVYERFRKWLDEGGRKKIEKTAADLIQIVIAGIEASIENILPIAIKVGSAIGGGILQGVKNSLTDSWLAQLIKDPVGFGIKKLTGGKIDLPEHQKGVKEKLAMSGKYGPLPYNSVTNDIKSYPKKNGGLNYVPYDGAQYSLHRGEMILPRGEAAEYRNSGGNPGVTITGNTFNVREEADIDRIGNALVQKWQQALEAGA